MKKFIRIIICLALAALIVALLMNSRKKQQAEASSVSITDQTEIVSVLKVEAVPIHREFSANAIVQAVTELNFVSDVQGRVIRIFVDKGSRVSKGTPLLEIDSELIEADYNAALAAYNSMKKDEERFKRTHKSGGVTEQQLDNIHTQVIAAESRLASAKWRKDNAVVKSPMSGTINNRFVETGSLIAPNTPLFEIVDNTKLKVICMIAENRIGYVHEGQKVTATDSSLPGVVFTGTVKNVGVKTDRGLNYPVEVMLDNTDALHIGMYLNVRFSDETDRNGILVPRKAVVGSAIAANVFLAVDGRAVRREVALGDMYGNEIEIVGGLSDGETIVVSGLMNVADGTSIRIAE